MPRAKLFPIALLFAASGCALTVHQQTPEDVRNAQKKDAFGELITAPGQNYSLNPSPEPLTGTIPTTPPVPVETKTAPKPATVVAPPNPVITPVSHPDQSQHSGEEGILPSIFRPAPGPDTPFLAAARAHEAGRADFAMEQLRAMPPANQDLLGKLLPAAAKTAIGNLNDPKEAGEILFRIESAADQLRPRSELRIDTLRVCTRAIDFGEYDPIPVTTPLRPGQLVVLYSEVKGAVAESIVADSEQHHMLRFNAALRIRDGGKLVKETTQKYQRTTRPLAHDVWVALGFPAPIQPGYYTAELELTDTAGRRAKRSVEFRVEDRK
jgi:hypothetical protein